jgi:hypothetical protein
MNRHRDRDRDRRREQRVTDSGMRARVRPGYRLIIIDLSARGALVEAGRPLRPGSHVDVHLETDARRGTVAARVLRCAVAAIDSESGVTYRAALSFTDTCDWVREALTQGVYTVPGRATGGATPAPGGGDQLPVTQDAAARTQARGAK